MVIPVKRLSLAKSRLRGATPGVPHDDLVLALAADTVAAALATPAVTAVLVVTDEPVVQHAVSEWGAVAVPDVPDAGLNPALAYGADRARRRHPGTAVAALGADLPALRPDALDAALTAAEAYPRSYVADTARTGTVLLAATPGIPLEPRFGPHSGTAHADSGAVELTGDWPSLRRDVDTSADLAEATLLGLGAATRALTTS
ncbi:MAG: 2-phospho-L-lactate guanylyltransferase [Micromonosporaceae bacterium]